MPADLIADTARTMLVAATTGLFAGGGMWGFMVKRLAAHQQNEAERQKNESARDAARTLEASELSKYAIGLVQQDNTNLRARIERLEAEVTRLRSVDWEVQRLRPFEARCALLEAELRKRAGGEDIPVA